MPDATPATQPRRNLEHAARTVPTMRSSREVSEYRSPARATDRYDEVDARLMDTFPASDAVARY